MRSSPAELPDNDQNPLDMIQDMAASRGWPITRHDEDLMTVVVKGQTAEFEVCMEWQEEFAALLFACSLPVEIKEAQHEVALRTLEQINQNMWMGHFDLSNKNTYPTYRYTLLSRMIPTGVMVDIVADVFEISMAECNRFYTTFQLVQAGDLRLQDNLHAAVFETIGEA